MITHQLEIYLLDKTHSSWTNDVNLQKLIIEIQQGSAAHLETGRIKKKREISYGQ